MWLKDILGGFGMKRFFIWFVLVLVFFSIPGSADNVDISSMTFEELIELRKEIDAQLMILYPDYDLILDDGDYFFGVDLEPGEIMMYQLNTGGTLFTVYDETDERIDGDSIADWQPRVRYNFIDGYKLRINRGPIGLKYLND